jgi:DNA mismatch endonuclease (patch repair protein)
MRRIKGSDALPERLLSEALEQLGVKHVRNDKTVPGTPDVAIHDQRVAIFVHGCFWHGCPLHYREPKSRQMFWRAKLQRTKARDRRARLALLAVGWKVATIWEHEVKTNPMAAAKKALGVESPYHGKGRKRNPYERMRRL